jgi:hypothetical protein
MSKSKRTSKDLESVATPKKTKAEVDEASPLSERDEASASSQSDQVVEWLDQNDYDWEEYQNYSGRGMYGAKSPFALIVADHPSSKLGQKLRGLGMSSDNMAFKYIYYFE